MKNGLINKAILILQKEGIFSFIRKTIILIMAKTVAFIGGLLYDTNSQKYWDFRMKWDWNFVGGGFQTQVLATSLFANINFAKIRHIYSMLDYGCATGDSAIVFRLFLPQIKKIFLYDVSQVGLLKAISRFQRFLPVEIWDKHTKVDLVYCSNVIEHVTHPEQLVEELIRATNKYIIIQCPWEELDKQGRKLTPDNRVGEHIWTIDEAFFDKYLKNPKIQWTLSKASVPMAWEGNTQAYYFGEILE